MAPGIERCPGSDPMKHVETGDTKSSEAMSNSRFDPTFTQGVIDAIGPKASPRVRQVMASLIQHVHDFARENEITVDEWKSAVEMINQAGRMSTNRRNEGQLLCDVIGLESLVDEITYKHLTEAGNDATASAILGPFWRRDAPRRALGTSIVNGIKNGDHTYIFGRVLDHSTREPIKDAELDVWHTAPNGLYDQQDERQAGSMNLRGRFLTGEDGRYNFYCLRPTSYPIPSDGPTGKLLRLMDRHPMRPAHIHLLVTAPGYQTLVTQIFDRRDEYLKDDPVFAVKESLIVDFLPRKNDPKAAFEVEFDFRLVPLDAAKEPSMDMTTLRTSNLRP